MIMLTRSSERIFNPTYWYLYKTGSNICMRSLSTEYIQTGQYAYKYIYICIHIFLYVSLSSLSQLEFEKFEH